jgi:hypothetical protein
MLLTRRHLQQEVGKEAHSSKQQALGAKFYNAEKWY